MGYLEEHICLLNLNLTKLQLLGGNSALPCLFELMHCSGQPSSGGNLEIGRKLVLRGSLWVLDSQVPMTDPSRLESLTRLCLSFCLLIL